MVKDRIIIVDGMNLFARHYVAHPAMSENGEQVGGIVGFFNNLVRLIVKCRPESVYVIWEGGGSKRKRDLYKDYKKGGRPQKLNRYYDDIPDTLSNRNFQLKSLINLLEFFPVQQVYVEESEADDVIGYMCKYTHKHKNKIIISSDHDYYQLIKKNVLIWSPTLKSFVDKQKVLERYGVHPNNFCLAKSIVGDKSDNIPGVPRVGYKNLVKEYGYLFSDESFDSNMEKLFADNLQNSTKSKKKIYHNIKNYQDLITRNYKLVLLDVNNLSHYQLNKINEKFENFNPAWKNMNAYRFLNDLGIKSIDLLSSNQAFRLIKGKN